MIFLTLCTGESRGSGSEPAYPQVSSREAPLRLEPDFGYSVGDARVHASRTPVGGGIPYAAPELPTLGSSDMLGSYRGSASAYSYTPAPKAYYPPMPAYGTPYGDEFEFGLGVTAPSAVNPEPVGMLPGQWNSGARAKPASFSSIYLDAEGSYGSYSSTSLLPRPSHSVNSDSPGFSFSSVAASLPLANAPGPDRVLPNPTGRSSTLPVPYPATVKPSASTSASTTSTLTDVATAANYAGGFDTPSLSFSSAASSSLSSHPSSSSRSSSDTFSGSDSIFSEQERSIASQGPAFDLGGYTASSRRASGGGSSRSTHAYVPAESAHEAAGHHHASQHHLPAVYMSDGPLCTLAHRHDLSLTAGSSAGRAVHTDDRQVALSSRH